MVDGETPAPCNDSEAKAAALEQSGRLSKVEWKSDPELRRGRGFEDQADSAIDASIDVAGNGIFPSHVSTEEPLRQESAASIASFAKSLFTSE